MDHDQKIISKLFPDWAAIIYVGFCFLFIPWIVYLGFKLPSSYDSINWNTVWVGFDIFESILFALTGILVILKNKWLALSAVALGITLFIDAWFDILTARTRIDTKLALISALGFELPMAILSIALAIRIFKKLKI